MSTLHEAAAQGDLEELARLIEAGVDVNARDSEGTTALMLAQSGGHSGCAALLRAAGARE